MSRSGRRYPNSAGRGLLAWLAVALVTISAIGCSRPSSSGGSSTCVPGEQLACDCVNGKEGFQVCAEDGSRLGPCQCGQASEPSKPSEPNSSGCVTNGDACAGDDDCCSYADLTGACSLGHCAAYCATDDDCAAGDCCHESKGVSACLPCDSICEVGEAASYVPSGVESPDECRTCLADNCCAEIRTYVPLAACRTAKCKAECNICSCSPGSCNGCDFAGDVVCCNSCGCDSCDYICN